MDPTTKNLKFEMASRVRKEPTYVTTTSYPTFFFKGLNKKELINDFFTDKSTYKVDLLISTSKEMLDHQELKVLIIIADKFYHFFIDSLPLIFKLYQIDPKIRFVLYLQRASHNKEYEDFLVLLFKILDGEGVKYSVISTAANQDFAPVYLFNNYVLIDDKMLNLHSTISMVDIQYSTDLAVKYSKHHSVMETDYNSPPKRKVYLTRGGRGETVGPINEEYKYYQNDLRIHDEDKLEKFFSEKGYEILEPETKFKTLMEQIAYMRQVKTLVSVTSSGLTNMIFMQPKQTVVEIQVEIVQCGGDQEGGFTQRLHPFYQVLSFMKEHTFISIPCDRDPDVVVETIAGDWVNRLV